VFANNPFPYDICSPLWTLPLEVRCYVLVLIAGLAGLLSSRWGVTLAAALGLLAFVVRVHLPHLEIGLRDFSSKPGGYSFWPEPFFLIGMLLYGWRERIEFYGLGALGLLMVFMVFRDTAGAQPLFYLAFVYGVMWIGTTPLLHRFVPRNDYSYGLYIYGFMMQQCVASIAPHLSHQMALLVGAPFMYGCAALSWHFVERPALAWCRRRMALPPRSLAVPMRTDTAVR
jgi:peptidoglycan/LPS O-acetylase OafA/YrhL